jgi:hypothetical protein
MSLAVKKDVLFIPVDVCLFSAVTIVACANLNSSARAAEVSIDDAKHQVFIDVSWS